MNKIKETFSCPSCGERVPFAKVWILNNNSTYRCKKCNTELMPEKMSPLYFVIGFISTAGTGHLLMKMNQPFVIVFIGSALAGMIIYLAGVLFAYKTVRFKIK